MKLICDVFHLRINILATSLYKFINTVNGTVFIIMTVYHIDIQPCAAYFAFTIQMVLVIPTDDTMMSLVKESSITSTDSTFDILSSLIPGGQQQHNRTLTTPFSPGRKTPELFTPTSKSVSCLLAKVRAKLFDCSGTYYKIIVARSPGFE